MSNLFVSEFLNAADPMAISGDEGYETGQVGSMLQANNEWENSDLVIVGCDEWRGDGPHAQPVSSDIVREQFYRLYHWHNEIKIADLGTIKVGAGLADTYAALKIVVKDLVDAGKKVLVWGGSHDCTLPLYDSFADFRVPCCRRTGIKVREYGRGRQQPGADSSNWGDGMIFG